MTIPRLLRPLLRRLPRATQGAGPLELSEWDGLRLMTLFRECLLAKLVEKRAISKELVARLVA